MSCARLWSEVRRWSFVGGVLLSLGCAPERTDLKPAGAHPPAVATARPASPVTAPTTVAMPAVAARVSAPRILPLVSAPSAVRTPAAPLVVRTAVAPVPRPDRDLIPAQDSPAGDDGTFRRERLVRRDVRYPLIRIEETVAREAAGERIVRQVEMVADHILVSAAPGIDAAAIGQLARRHAVEVRARVPGTHSYLLSFTAEDHQALARVKAALQGEPALHVIEPDYLVHTTITPDDPAYGNLWGMNNLGQTGGVVDADINAPEAWELGTGRRAVRVGVIDTGIDYTHGDLAANIWTNPGESGNDGVGQDKRINGIDDDGNGFIDDWHGWDFVNNDNDPMDDHYHGTHCAGTIGGTGSNGIGVAGVCWQVSLVGLKFLDANGSGYISDGLAALTYADQLGLDLTSNSWGGGGFSQAFKDAIDAAGGRGQLFVAAAGNHSSDNDAYPFYPANYESDNLISVAATDHTDARAYFSCFGATTVDLGAPGANIYSTMPGDSYGFLSGTSMATPHVAGACALLKSINPSLTGTLIKQTLLAQVRHTAAMQGLVLSNGRLDLAASALAIAGPELVAAVTSFTDSPVVDGIISPGELATVAVVLANVGNEAATNVTGVLTSGNAEMTVVQPVTTYGTIMVGQQVASAQAAVFIIASPLATPHQMTATMTVTGDLANGQQRTWTVPITVTVATASTINGQVVRLTGGAPIAGALVTAYGPATVQAETRSDGRFSMVVMDGSHTLVAQSPGLIAGVPQVITTPPGTSGVLFALGAPDLAVDQSAMVVQVGQGETASRALVIANHGDLSLHASIAGSLGEWLTWDQHAIELQPAVATSVAVTLTPELRLPGAYEQEVIISSDDPDAPVTRVPITMLVEARPYPVLGPITIDDDHEVEVGDADGFPEPGEFINLVISLGNAGAAQAMGVTATLATSDPYAFVVRSHSVHGDIETGGSATGTAVSLAISAGCPLDHQLQLSYTVHDAAGREWMTLPVMVVVSRSRLYGTIRDLTTGLGIPGVDITVAGIVTTTGDDGTYVAMGVPPGSWMVTASRSGFIPVSATIAVPPDTQWDADLGAPRIVVTPTALAASVQLGESIHHQLTVANTGNLPLTWTLGLPFDGHGYHISTSDQPGGPTYTWNDIRSTGTLITALPNWTDDVNVGPFPLGFTFPFFDGSMTEFRLCSNGWLSPTSTSASYSTMRLPDVNAPRPLIAFFWRDLYFYPGSVAHYQQTGPETFILQFTDVGLFGHGTTGPLLTCQVVLTADGVITMYYQRMDLPYATVGLQNADGTAGNTATHHEAFLHDGMAVRFASSAISASPRSGVLAAGTSSQVDIMIDSALRGVGLHDDVLTITSDDPVQGVVQIPMRTRVVFGSLPVVDPLTVSTFEDNPVAFTLTARDGDGDPLSFYVIEGPAYGVLGGSLPDLTYTPSPDWSGTDHITVVVTDPYQTSDPVVVPIVVAPVNDPPSVYELFPGLTAWVGQPFSGGFGNGISFFDRDEGDFLTLSLTPLDRLWPEGLSFDGSTWLFSGTPTIASLGITHFLVTVTDQAGASATAHFYLEVRSLPTTDKLLADDGVDGHLFATDVAFAGDDVIVGAPWAGARGQVYHFRRVAGSWEQRAVILPLASDDMRFGSAVALHGGVLVVSSSVGEQVLLTTFERDASGWRGVGTQVVPIAAASLLPGEELDRDHRVDLALSDTALVVGTPFDGSGSVRVFVRDGEAWSQRNRIAGGSQFQRLGWNVALSGDRLAAGAPRASFVVADTGAVLVAAGITTAISDLTVQLPLTFEAGAYFGYSVALDRETLVVGAPGCDGDGQDQGQAFVFTLQSGGWSHLQTLATWITYSPTSYGYGVWYGRFGAAVAVQGNRLMVGAPGSGGWTWGEIHGYARLDAAGFVRVQTSYQPDPAAGSGFGSVLAMDRDRVVVATPADDDRGSASGSAYVVTMNVNHAPTVAGMALTVTRDSSVQVALAPQDVDGDATGLQIVDGPLHGTATLVGMLLRYVPEPGYTGADAIALVADDGSLTSSPAMVAIMVTPYPECYLTDFIQVEGDQGTTSRVLTAWLNIPSSQPISIAWSTHGGNGSPVNDYLASSGTLVFAPGMLSLPVTIPVIGDTRFESDEVVPIALSSAGHVILPAVEPALIIVNDDANTAPVIAEGEAVAMTGDEDSAPQPFLLTLHASESDEGQATHWEVSGLPLHGEVSLSGDALAASIHYTPAADHHGSDHFVVRVSDGYGGEDTIAVTVTIQPRNDAPVVTAIPELSVVSLAAASRVLRASTGTWNDGRDLSPGAITYAIQWQWADDAAGTGHVDIAGATAWEYTTGYIDRGRFLGARVTASDDGEGAPGPASSSARSLFVYEPSVEGGDGQGNRCGLGGGVGAMVLLVLLSVMRLRRQRPPG